jgi:hypothetical protein
MLTGDWDRVTRMLGEIGTKLKAESQKATVNSLNLIEKTAVGHIDKQDLNWAPLAESTMRQKLRSQNPARRRKRRKQGKTASRLSEKILVATGAYRNSISSFATSAFSGEVGVARVETSADGESMVNIGAVQELGSRDGRIPARELWRPTAEEVEERVINNYLKAGKVALRV